MMALTVEGGTGLSDADSLASLAEFETFLSDNAISATATDAQKEAWLREATRYHEATYDYPAPVLNSTQALRLPLNQVITTADGRTWDGVPAKLKEAICLLAAEARNGPLVVNLAAKRKVKSKTDVIESEFVYDDADRRRVFLAADDLVRQLGGWKTSGITQVSRA